MTPIVGRGVAALTNAITDRWESRYCGGPGFRRHAKRRAHRAVRRSAWLEVYAGRVDAIPERYDDTRCDESPCCCFDCELPLTGEQLRFVGPAPLRFRLALRPAA